jgi:hypothetical protein
LDDERLCARRARRAEAQDGPSKVAYGAFSERAYMCFLPAGKKRGFCRLVSGPILAGS